MGCDSLPQPWRWTYELVATAQDSALMATDHWFGHLCMANGAGAIAGTWVCLDHPTPGDTFSLAVIMGTRCRMRADTSSSDCRRADDMLRTWAKGRR